MDPIKIIAMIDAATVVAERGKELIDEAKAEGLISADDQREVRDKFDALKSRLGRD